MKNICKLNIWGYLIIILMLTANLNSNEKIKLIENEQRNEYLTLDDFIQLARRNNIKFQEILIDEVALKYKRKLKSSVRDLILSITPDYTFSINDTKNSFNIEMGLNKLFSKIGTEILLSYKSSLIQKETNNESELVDFEPNTEFEISVLQPIIRNAFGRANRINDKIADIEIDVLKHQIIETYEDYLSSLMKLYYKWTYAYSSLKLAKKSFLSNQKILKEMQERRRNNIALPIDVNKVLLQTLNSEENLLTLQKNYNMELNLIKQATRLKEDSSFIPKLTILQDKIIHPLDEEIKLFKNQSRTSMIMKFIHKKGELNLNKYFDALLPSASLSVGYNFSASGFTLDQNQINNIFVRLYFDETWV